MLEHFGWNAKHLKGAAAALAFNAHFHRLIIGGLAVPGTYCCRQGNFLYFSAPWDENGRPWRIDDPDEGIGFWREKFENVFIVLLHPADNNFSVLVQPEMDKQEIEYQLDCSAEEMEINGDLKNLRQMFLHLFKSLLS